MKSIAAIIGMLLAIACNQKKNQYEDIIAKADSCGIRNGDHVVLWNMTGDTLAKYKEVLVRAVMPESQRIIKSNFIIELYNLRHKLGTLTIESDHSTTFANFDSEKLSFGFRISYGLGMSLDEMESSHFHPN